MLIKKLTAFVAMVLGLSLSAIAETGTGPVEKGIGLLPPVTDLARELGDFHVVLMWVISLITLFVFLLLVWVVVRYNRKANPTPATFTHNTFIEVVWTVLPIIILVGIAIPSVRLLYFQEEQPDDIDFAIEVTGKQWFWTYKYPDHGGIEFNSNMVPGAAFPSDPEKNYDPEVEQAALESLRDHLGYETNLNARLLDTDTRLVIPVNTKISIQMTANDVIHAWTVPNFGVKMDAVPGRLNSFWFEVDQIGTYYGQCSELCGQSHAFMPIAVEVVSKEDFAKWVEHAKGLYAEAPQNTNNTALGR